MEAIDATFNIQAILCRIVSPMCPIFWSLLHFKDLTCKIFTRRESLNRRYLREKEMLVLKTSVNINASLYRIIYVVQTLFFNCCNYLYCYYV